MKNFEGKTITLIGEVPDLKVLRWGDKISSIKIQRAQKDINVALAFQHSDFKGEFLTSIQPERRGTAQSTMGNENDVEVSCLIFFFFIPALCGKC